MKAKAKAVLECAVKAVISAQRKVEAESAFGHIRGNRSFRGFSLRGLNKVYVEFGLVALSHNLLKVADIRQLLSDKNKKSNKWRKINFSHHLPVFLGLIKPLFFSHSFLIFVSVNFHLYILYLKSISDYRRN